MGEKPPFHHGKEGVIGSSPMLGLEEIARADIVLADGEALSGRLVR